MVETLFLFILSEISAFTVGYFVGDIIEYLNFGGV